MTTNQAAVAGRLAGTRSAADLPHNCHCGARWSGSTTCHCGQGGCHLTFSSVGAFSRHRRDGKCLDPQAAGLVPVAGRAFDCWGFPTGAVEDADA
jgi:hypothetical protein